jgi:hypothetical protein
MTSMRDMIEPFARQLDAAARAMAEHDPPVGGVHPGGHQFRLRAMASHLRSESSMNRWPSSFPAHMADAGIYASSDDGKRLEGLAEPVISAIKAARVDRAMDDDGTIPLRRLDAATDGMEPGDRLLIKNGLIAAKRITGI